MNSGWRKGEAGWPHRKAVLKVGLVGKGNSELEEGTSEGKAVMHWRSNEYTPRDLVSGI